MSLTPEEETEAFIGGAKDAMKRVIADLREKASAAEALRNAECRALIAEAREVLASVQRDVERTLALLPAAPAAPAAREDVRRGLIRKILG